MRLKIISLYFLLSAAFCQAQETYPTNGALDKSVTTTVLLNATVHTDAFTVLEHAHVVISEGRVLNVNGIIPANAIQVDLNGKHVYPSFIDLNTSYGMPKVQSSQRSRRSAPQYESNKKGAYGWNETLNPERRASLLVKHDEKLAISYRSSGFGMVLSHHKDGIHRGSGTAICLGKSEQLNLIIPEASAHLSFNKGSSRQSYPNSLMGIIALIRQTNYDAQWYASSKNTLEENLTLAAVNELNVLPQFFETRDKLDVLRADKIGDEFAQQYIFMGNGDEYQRLEEIKSTNGAVVIPVNYPKPFDVSDPFLANWIELEELKHWELAPYNAFFLEDQNIPFTFSSHGLEDRSMFLANVRKAVKMGLSEKRALAALTSVPASLIGLENELGKLQDGFWANMIVTDKPIFSKDAKILQNWVQGEQFIISKSSENKLSGAYNLSLESNVYRLRIKPDGKAILLTQANENADDSLGVKVKLSQSDLFMNLNFTLKDETGVYRLSGSNLTSGKILEGKGVSPSGTEFEWVAAKLPESSSESKSMSEKEMMSGDTLTKTPPYEKLIYPFTAYGSDDELDQETLLIKNATIWTNDSIGKLERGELLIQNGKIKAVGEKINLEDVFGKKWQEIEVKTIDAFGHHVTAGIIDEHSHIAISRGVNEGSQASTAEVRIGDVVDSEDINIYRQLSGGVTTSQLLHGSANPIGGQSALIKLRWGLTPEEMKFDGADGFIKFALGENVKQANWGNTFTSRFPQTRMGVEQVYFDHFHRAREYNQKWLNYDNELASLTNRQRRKGLIPEPPRVDLELQALGEILTDSRFITCHSYMQHEINMLMNVGDSMGFRVNTFTHILEGYKVADKMREHGAGASSFSDWWAYKYEVKDAIPHNGAVLWEQGITVAFNSDDAEMARRLNQEAAKAVKYGGVPEEEALKFVTLNPAKLLHIDDRVGSLTVGKDADFVIWTDHPLSIYAKSKFTYIDGICYYSLERDLELRDFINAERNRLIQLMAGADQSGGTQPAGKRRTQRYHCNSLTHECH